MDWYSVHVRYNDPVKDRLVLDAVRPLFDRVRAHGAAYYMPHWRLGPHLRLNFRTSKELFSRTVLPTALEVMGGFLEKHPSTTRLDPAAFLPMHRRLAELEGEQGPLEPWRSDNSLCVAPYDLRADVLRSKELAEVLTEFHVAATPSAFSMTEQVRQGGQRLGVAFDLMVATAHGLSGAGAAGFVSFRSHAEAFLTNGAEGAGRRESWERHYRRHAAPLNARLREVIATVDGERDTVPFVRAWVDLLTPYAAHAGDLAAAEAPLFEAAGRDLYGPLLPAQSPFHRTLEPDDALALLRAPGFTRYRLLLNLTYLQLTRLGVSPEERFLLCHLAASAGEEFSGISSEELVRAWVRKVAR
ncbi:thiopeptide maturation pyridine synthase [Streptomyces sp. NPDC048483]|uniref:thiopeptide maturation pyridine synthase n=1 Tax=Streptomyces sp. NPDC048483 TaxID=3154927 RepID=UPI0034261EC8